MATANELSIATRSEDLNRAAEGRLDLLIVGAGITGAGVAREAALAGYSALVVDKGDFASGTSSRSSKLIHGGVRYLAQGDLPLVREAARERAVLRRLAPHLATPVRMLIPTTSRGARMKLATGLWTFDQLAGDANLDRHEVLDRGAVLAAERGLLPDPVGGGVAFTEYVTNDARLTLETIRAAVAQGALAANYAEVAAIEAEAGGVRAVIEDRLTGGQLVVRARCLVNAAGPWFDAVRALGEPGIEPVLQLTRGIHLVFERHRLAVENSVVLRAPDGRSAFVVPRGRFAYVGTTDTIYSGEREEPGIGCEDVEYLLAAVSAAFGDLVTPADVIGTWSGVRPLLRQEGKKPSEISRRDEIKIGPGPIVAIAGGKLTTFRRMGERVLAAAAPIVGHQPAHKGASARVPLAGGDREEQERLRAESLRLADAALEARLWATYGTAAAAIASRVHADPSAGEPVGELADLCGAEIGHAVDAEMAVTVDDVLRRRTPFGLFDIEHAAASAPAVAALLASRLGWSAERAAAEVARFRDDRIAELAQIRSATR